MRKVLLLGSSDPGTTLLKEILAQHTDASSVSDIPELLSLLSEEPFDALFCDWRFPLGTWWDVLESVQRLYPQLPLIVVCRKGGEREWREVLDAGAFDLLTEPFSERAVLYLLEHALVTRDVRARIRPVA